MEVIYPVSDKKAIHPIGIFKEGFSLWVRNFLALGSIYLILYLPVITLQILFLELRVCGLQPGLKGNSYGNKLIALLDALLGSWAFIALTIGLNKAADGQACRIMENIKAAGRRFFPYLGTGILYVLLVGLVGIVSALGATVSFLLLRDRYIVLGIVISSLAVIVGVCAGVYFAIRLSLGSIVSIIEEQGPIIFLKRSYRLIKNYVTPVVGEYCFLALLSLIFFLPLILLGFLGFAAKDAKLFYLCVIVSWYLLNAALTPFFVGIMVTLYQKLKEAAE